jgi:mutator protein MutT
MPAQAIEVSAGLVFREGRLLITRRRMQDHLGGLWEFPGGKREPAESFEDCLRRELLEELGIEVRVGELAADILHAYPDKTVYLRFYRCVWVSGEPRPMGCEALAWVGMDDLSRYAFPAADRQLIEQLDRRRDWWIPAPPGVQTVP